MSIKKRVSANLGVFVFAYFSLTVVFLTSLSLISVDAYAYPLSMRLRDTYQDNAPADSIDGARGMQIDTIRKIAFISSNTDDSLTGVNFSNPQVLTAYGSVSDSAPLGSLDGIWFGSLDSVANIFYVPSATDSTTSWYDVSAGTFVFLNDTAADTAGAGSQQGERDVSIVDIGSTRWLLTGGLTDDIVSSFNVTNPNIRPAVVSSFTDAIGACSVDGMSNVYNIPGTSYIIVTATVDSYVTLLNVSIDGTITCIGSGYTDTAGAGSIQGLQYVYYENSTGYLYVTSPSDGYMTILQNVLTGTPSLLGSVGGLTTPVSVTVSPADFDGTKYAFVGSSTAGVGIRIINITLPALPTLVTEAFNQTLDTCIYNGVYSMNVLDNYLYVTSSTDACFYAVELNYSDSLMNISLSSPIDAYYNNSVQFVNLTFNATVSDANGLVNCSFWTNYSGSWSLNQTQTVNGVSNVTSFNLVGLTNTTFVWNIQCYDGYSNFGWADTNWTVILKWPPADYAPNVFLSSPSDNYYNESMQFFNITFEATVTDDYGLVNCSFWTNYSGSWSLNQTQTVSGVSNVTSFNLTGLTNKNFIWNIRCYDNTSKSTFGASNWSVILNWTAPPEANFSIQKYYISLGPGVNSGFAPFTGGQTSFNSVPFVTMNINMSGVNDFWNLFLPDVYFNDTGIIVARNASALSVMNLMIYVVQFDNDDVRVQSGTFNLTTGSTAPSIGNDVNLSSSALIFYYSSSDVTDDYIDNSVRGNITDVNQLSFSTSAATGFKSGHWYVFESLDGGFTVQRTTLDFASADTTATGNISAIDTTKTFLIASYITSETSDDPIDGSLYVNLSDSTTVTGVRLGAPAATLNANVFVVTFSGDETVRRGSLSYSAGVGSASDTLSAVNMSASMAWNPVLTGRMADNSATNAIESSFQLLNLTSSTSISGVRAETTGTALGVWEVIDWMPFQAPFIDSVNVDDNITPIDEIILSAGFTRPVNCTVIASDALNSENIINASATFYYYMNSSSNPDDDAVHYTNSSCSVISSNSTSKTFFCAFNAIYYANNGTWQCNATVYNNLSLSATANDSVLINPLYAVNISDGMAFGDVEPNTASTELRVNMTNLGNMPINISVLGYARIIGDNYSMNCSDNTNLSISAIRYSNVTSTYLSKTSLTATAQHLRPTMVKPTSATPVLNYTYWQIMPDPYIGSISRYCEGYVIFSAESSQ